MGKKRQKRDLNLNETNEETVDNKDGTGKPEQNHALESVTGTDLQNKQKKCRNENVKLNTDGGFTVPDQYLNTITEGKSKKAKKPVSVEKTPEETPCPAEESRGNSTLPAKLRQNKKKQRTNKIEVLETDIDSEVQLPLQNPITLAKGSSKKNKKIIFEDTNMPTEVSSGSTKSNKKKQNFNSEEEEVKDEDIDQFCEDIAEEDNAQFEDWVKLIEAKLGPNKN